MKLHTWIAIPLVLMLGFLTGCSDQNASQTKVDATLPVIAMSDLVHQAGEYAGKTVVVTGLFGGMCPDGADFYFKDKLELIEVYPPAEGMPKDIVIGTPLKVQGVVLAEEHEEQSEEKHHEEGGEKESEVKIQAVAIEVNRS